MPLDIADEYKALRDEMMRRFERIHDTMKYGVGLFVVLLAYYYTSGNPEAGIALLLLLLLILLVGLVTLELYQQIYLEGTHIAVLLEGSTGLRWHRMSRRYGDYRAKRKKEPAFPFGSRWGADSAVISYLLFALLLLAWGGVATKVGSLNELANAYPISLVVGLLLTVVNVILCYGLLFGIRSFREITEATWLQYAKDFGTTDFPDPYDRNAGKRS